MIYGNVLANRNKTDFFEEIFTIFVVPNSSYHRSLESKLFNVATSRSTRHTIIIVDKNVLNRSQIDNEVKQYLKKLDEEFSFYIPVESKLKMLSK